MKDSIKRLLQRDSMGLGIILGIALPLILFGILYAVSTTFSPPNKEYLIKLSTLILISVFSNLATIRYYLLTLKFDKTGRGILLVTFILAISYFAVYLRIIPSLEISGF